jgi:DNA-directed RNA polymerase subunit RPC12/RpoP
MKKMDENKCMDCGKELNIKIRYPVYSARLAVTGYRCRDCNEKAKSPETRKREEEMSKFIKEIPQPENVKQDIRRSLENK